MPGGRPGPIPLDAELFALMASLTSVVRWLRHNLLPARDFTMEEGEHVVAQLYGARSIGGFPGGTAWSLIVLTNRRLLWRPRGLPFFDSPVSVSLRDIVAIDRGKLKDRFVAGGGVPRFGIVTEHGKRFLFFSAESDADREAFLTKLSRLCTDERRNNKQP